MKCRCNGCHWPATRGQTTCTSHRYLDTLPPAEATGRDWFFVTVAVLVACVVGYGGWFLYSYEQAARSAEPVDTAEAR